MENGRRLTEADKIREERVDQALALMHESLFHTDLILETIETTPPLEPQRKQISPLEARAVKRRLARICPRVIWHGDETVRENNDGSEKIWYSFDKKPYSLLATNPQDEGRRRMAIQVAAIGENDVPDIYFSYRLGEEFEITVLFKEPPDDNGQEQNPRTYSRTRSLEDMTPAEYEVASYVLDKAIEIVPPVDPGFVRKQNNSS